VQTVDRATVPGVPLPGSEQRSWRRYVALGDSLSEGLGAPAPGGTTRGWASLLADRAREQRPDLEFTNLAVRGSMARHVLRRQLKPALDLQPDLVSVFIGGNDCLFSAAFATEHFTADLDRLVAPFAERGSTVVMSTLPDLTACSPILPPYRSRLRQRLVTANAVIEQVSRSHGTVLLDAWSDPRTRRHGMWSIDRIHPSADGHRLIAASVASLLGLPPHPSDTQPPAGSVLAVARRHVAEARWLLQHGFRPPER